MSYTGMGWAVVSDDAAPDLGVIGTSSEMIDVARAHKLTAAVLELVKVREIDLVAVEGYSFALKGNAVTRLAELGGILRYRLWRREIAVKVIPPTEWRKVVCGRGNLPKDLCRLEISKRYGVEHKDMNAIEAWAVGQCALMLATGLVKPPIKRGRAA